MALLSYEDLAAKGIVLARTTINSKAIAGSFPKPIKSFDRRNLWRESDIDVWLAEQGEQGGRI